MPRWEAFPGTQILSVPVWLPVLILVAPTLWLWVRDRRPKPGHCQRCGYDLTGNTSGVCPECGTRK
ncbi:MAG TPA: hypothetical protein VGM03_00550 [Phycisphaerae bacterium]